MFGINNVSPNLQASTRRSVAAKNAASSIVSSTPVTADGSSVLHRDTTLIGQASIPGTQMIGYARFKRTSTGLNYIWTATNVHSGTFIQHRQYISGSNNRMSQNFDNKNDGNLLWSLTSDNAVPSNEWVNVLWAYSVNDDRADMYFGDTQEYSTITPFTTEFTLFDTGTYWTILGSKYASNDPRDIFGGEISHFYLCATDYVDIRQESERRKFYDADGNATDLSTAPEPIIQFSSAESWSTGVNEGTGGDFTVIGSFS